MKTLENQASTLTKIEQNIWPLELPNPITIKLNCNEISFDLTEDLKKELTVKMIDLAWNRYPDFQQTTLCNQLANSVHLKSENILLGNGSSQLIQQIINYCSKFVSESIIENPTFTLYHQLCKNERLAYREWQLNDDGTFDLMSFPHISEPALVIITSPNNPTGAVISNQNLKVLLEQHPSCIFLIDEAYGEFANESAIELVNQYSNLLVLRTFSKGFGLPSIRFGYVAGSKVLIDSIRKHTIPFTINIFSELIVRESLTNPALISIIKGNQERIKNLRDFVTFLLQEFSNESLFTVYQSHSNFILLRFHDNRLLEQIKQTFASKNILVSYPIPSCLRLTIGTEVEMSKVVRLIKYCVETLKKEQILMLETVI